MAGERSGLFMEQIRIVKEMRERERSDGRTGELVRPRYMVWENVPGALSSNGGNDFAAVLKEIIKIAEPEEPHIQVPEHGWPTWGGYRDLGGRWSVAYRIHDAQWWGVPQRRRRISVVADFGGSTAHEILFEPCGVSGNTSESGAQGERLAGAIERGTYPAVARTLTARYDGSPCADRGPDIVYSPNQGGCDGGGKGALVQTEKSGTLGTGNDQTLFCMNPWDSQSARVYDGKGVFASLDARSNAGQSREAVFCMATQQGGAEIRADDKAPTLTAAAGMSGNNQPVVIPINDKATRFRGGGDTRKNDGSGNGLGIGKDGDPAPTITAADKHIVAELKAYGLITKGNGEAILMNEKHCSLCTGGGQLGQGYPACLEIFSVAKPPVCVAFKSGQGAKAGGIGYEEEIAPTLSANSGGNQVPAVMAFDTTQICSKENGSVPAYGKPCHTLNAHAHAPSVVLDMSHANDVIRECGDIVLSLQARMGTGGNQVPLTYQMQGFGDYREGKVASSCKQRDYKDSTDLVCAVDCRNFTENGNVNGTLQAKESGGSSLNLNNVCRQSGTVRRLTPLECTRLQGFPDGWVDIGEWTDEKGRVHKEADAPKYKALGNSIALPFWKWLLRRISDYLPEDATLGSLFDGIAGFPLCWAEIHGAENCRWASEIEQFPIAVVKRHFGDEDAGIVGDVDKFLREGN